MSAYTKSYQQVPPPFQQKDGHVKIEFLTGDEEKDWKEEALDRLPGVVEQLQDNGYDLKDIAVLVRTNMEGAMVADKLLSYKESNPSDRYHYDIISDDALFVSGSPAVRFMIALLRYLRNPEDKINEQTALYSYRILQGAIEDEDHSNLYSVVTSANIFPPEIAAELQTLSRQSLYEISEGLFRLFSGDFQENEITDE